MDKKYNGFNNGRDKSDGVGGREVNHGTQQSMTKAEMIYPKIGIEPKQFTDTHQERCYPLTVVSDLMDEWAAQEVAKEREKSKKLVEALMRLHSRIIRAASQNANYAIQAEDVKVIEKSLIEYNNH